ncbi:MAG: alanine dehydrogenase [Alphaproteobacteria bacterium]|nr:alanine dehydrogenase [Alphaproteobacteria bacterium]
MLLLDNNDVAKVLDMPLCMAALDGVFQELARGEAVGMGRIDVYVPSGETPAPYYRWAVMTGGSKKDGLVCARMLSDMVAWPREYGRVRENKYAREPGTFLGLLFLFSAKDATPVAMIKDGFLQHLRVGGGAGLGVKYLSRTDAQTVGMIGSGGMARTYLDAFCQVRKIRKVKVWSPNADNVRAYAREMSERHGLEVEPAASAREAVRGVEIVSCCTSTNEPVFFNDWLEPGMHVTNLTSSEIEPSLPRIVDVAMRAGEATPRIEQLPPEADYFRAGFLGYVAGSPQERATVPKLTLPPEIINMPRLVDLIAGKTQGRTSDDQTSFFLNVGAIGAQFEGVAAAVYNKARAQKLGTEIPTDWFLQDIRD